MVASSGRAEAAERAKQEGKSVAEHAKSESTEVAHSAKEKATSVADSARQEAAHVADAAAGEARRLVDEARSTVMSEAEGHTQKIADKLDTIASQLRALADGRPEQAGEIKQYADDAARKLTEYADHVKQRGFDGMVQDTRRFASRKPGVFLFGTAVLGFAAGRFARAQQRAKQEQHEHQQQYTPVPAAPVAEEMIVLPDEDDVVVEQRGDVVTAYAGGRTDGGR